MAEPEAGKAAVASTAVGTVADLYDRGAAEVRAMSLTSAVPHFQGKIPYSE